MNDGQKAKGAAKGAAKAKGSAKGSGKSSLPKGIKTKTPDNKPICFAYMQGNACAKNPCPFEHVCWWCGGVGCAKCP